MANKQAYVEQSGTVTPGNYAVWSSTGVIQDGGPVPPTNAVGPYTEQSGEVTPGHLAVWTYDGVIEDGGAVPDGILGYIFRQGPLTGATNAIVLNPGTTTIFCDTSGGPVGIQLPIPSASYAHVVNIVDQAGKAYTNNITITVSGGSTIRGQSSLIIDSNWGGASLADSTTLWSVI